MVIFGLEKTRMSVLFMTSHSGLEWLLNLMRAEYIKLYMLWLPKNSSDMHSSRISYNRVGMVTPLFACFYSAPFQAPHPSTGSKRVH